MAERGRLAAGEGPQGTDRELDLRGIWAFAGLVGSALVGVHLIVWFVVAGLEVRASRRDPAPSPIPEANLRHLPPAPNLQPDPLRDIDRMHEREEGVLTTYGWVDQDARIARIPVERAMALVLERGLPATPAQGSGVPAPAPPKGRAIRSSKKGGGR
jgi:hypothetical protein